MKALVATAYGPPESLSLVDLPSPAPGPGQIAIRVACCGVNFPDALIIEGKYQLKPPLPFAPGCEVAGVVKELGSGVTTFRLGERVAVVTGYGGFAEEIVAEAAQAVPIPPNVDDAVA